MGEWEEGLGVQEPFSAVRACFFFVVVVVLSFGAVVFFVVLFCFLLLRSLLVCCLLGLHPFASFLAVWGFFEVLHLLALCLCLLCFDAHGVPFPLCLPSVGRPCPPSGFGSGALRRGISVRCRESKEGTDRFPRLGATDGTAKDRRADSVCLCLRACLFVFLCMCVRRRLAAPWLGPWLAGLRTPARRSMAWPRPTTRGATRAS